jgi:hypothetical protein
MMKPPATAAIRLRREQPERHRDLHEVAERHARALCEPRKGVEVRTQRARHRLRLVVVVEAGEVAPAAVVPELDQSRAELDAK